MQYRYGQRLLWSQNPAWCWPTRLSGTDLGPGYYQVWGGADREAVLPKGGVPIKWELGVNAIANLVPPTRLSTCSIPAVSARSILPFSTRSILPVVCVRPSPLVRVAYYNVPGTDTKMHCA
eukprot:777213-Rhodomonas_salina.6